MEIAKIVAIAIISLIVIGILKQHRPEFATYASMIAGIIILYFAFESLYPIVHMLQNLSNKLGVSNKFFIE